MSGRFANLFDWDGMMADPNRRAMLGMGMSLLGDSGYSRVPVTLSQALGRGFLQGLDQHGKAKKAQLAADARRVEQAEAQARRAEAQFKQDLMREKLGFEQNKFRHQQAKDREAAAQRARLLGFLGPRGSAEPPGPSAPPDHNPDPARIDLTGGTGSPREPVPGPAGSGDPSGQQGFPLTPREAMALKAAGLPDFTDDVADHQRQQLAQQKFAYQQKKDDKDFHYKINEKRINDLRTAHDALRDALASYPVLEEAEALLDQGIYSGSMSERMKHYINKKIPMNRDKLARTEAYVSVMGRRVLATIKQLGSGTAISNADLIFTQEIEGQSLDVSIPGLKKIIEIAKNGIRNTLKDWNEDLPKRQRGLEAYFPESMNFEVPGQAEPAKPVDQWTDEELLEYMGR
ncbi:MAG: ribosome-recycling factor [gamma proteobacterium symbiont of Clathrolucina costata]